MASFNVKENFITITEFRSGLTDLAERFRGLERELKNYVAVDVITERGKPIATVMPYSTYTRIRDLILLTKAHADVEAGRVVTFPRGTSAEEVLDSILGRAGKDRTAKE